MVGGWAGHRNGEAAKSADAADGAAALADSTGALVDLFACDFLLGYHLDGPTLQRAGLRARQLRRPVHEVLLAQGLIPPDDYAAALATWLGVPIVSMPTVAEAEQPATGGLPDDDEAILAADSAEPEAIARRVDALRATGRTPAIGPCRRVIARRLDAAERKRLDERARLDLHQTQPALSAAGPVRLWQTLLFTALAGLFIGGMAITPDSAVAALAAFVAVPFALIAALRMVALVEVLRRPRANASRRSSGLSTAAPTPELAGNWPTYSVLVPLYREAAVVDDLVSAMAALDYPPERLEVFLIVEEDDQDTRAALRSARLPAFMHVIVVPPSLPRTKPKALNYALQLASGDLIAVFDAEDVPEPRQLKQAAERFLAPREPGRPTLAVLQAALGVHNMQDTWLSRQFTLEYTALFDALLPAIVRLGLPVPLGGTSNHLSRRALLSVGAWDPYNVTEDCDLGVRLARAGYHVDVLASTTWEEAPTAFGPWARQRTRWLKGWMQTWLVHMRSPLRLWRELGPWRFLGFNGLIGGLVLSALIQPVFCVLLAIELLSATPFRAAATPLGAGVWGLAVFNLAAGYTAAMLLALVAIRRRRRPVRLRDIISIPLYWLLIGCVAWRALVQLIFDPHRWEKTAHQARSARPPI